MSQLVSKNRKWNAAFGAGTFLLVGSGIVSRLLRGDVGENGAVFVSGQVAAVVALVLVSWWCVTHVDYAQGCFIAVMYAGYCLASAISAATAGELTGAIITVVAIFIVSPIFLASARFNEPVEDKRSGDQEND